MKPVLLATKLGGVEIWVPTYGVLVTIGMAVAIVLVVRQGKRQGLPAEALLDLCWWLLLAGLAGSRVFYVVQNAGDYWNLCSGSGAGRSTGAWLRDCAAPLRLWDGGLVFYGGALFAAAVAFRFARKRNWSFPLLGDLFAPALAAGHAIGRLGCFAAGCCYGKACAPGAHLGVQFPPGSVAHERMLEANPGTDPSAATVSLFPTQLMESLALLLLFGFLLWWRRGRQKFTGQLFLLYVAGYSVVRFLVEIYRGDGVRRFVAEVPWPALARALGLPPEEPLFLSTSQAVSLVLLAGAMAATQLVGRRARRAGTPQVSPS
jgi:phosphatidylglycerol---prolipoprotein diacylglyceryl transferase